MRVQDPFPCGDWTDLAIVNEGGFAYSQATGAMYYSNAVSWTSQRLVTTNSSSTSDFSTLLVNTQLT